MQVSPKIFKAYDVRGIYPEEVNEEVAYLIGRAFVKYLNELGIRNQESGIVVGRDMRLSGPMLADAVIRGITQSGINALDVGLVSTPSFYFAVRHLKAGAGIQVSASHNPKEYNGFKIVRIDKKGIVKVGIESGLGEIRDLIMKNEECRTKNECGGEIKKIFGIQEAEMDAVFKLVPLPDNIPPLTIVADSANAMGGPMLDAFFARVPSVKLARMNFELDGTFPAHQPDPLQFETLRDLQARVIKEKADFGIAPDGDGDRLFFIDERGEVVPASHITALVAREMLQGQSLLRQGLSLKPKILYDVRYAWNAKNAIIKYGGIPIMGKVGHAFISEHLRRENGVFAGESSGHYFFRDSGYAESPLIVLLYVLRAIAREKKPLSEIIAPLISSYESGEINFKLDSREKAQAIMNDLEKKYSDGEITKIDGLAIEFFDWRFSLRAANTEPLLRLNVEGKTREVIITKKQELQQFLIPNS